MIDASHNLRIFLCHASGDKKAVRDLYQSLLANGFDPWFDEEKLLPGVKWAQQIPKVVRESDVVIICLSQASINKIGYVQREINYALDAAEERPDDAIFLIPLRLEECDIPDRLAHWQYVDLFDTKGYARLLDALIYCSGSLSANINRSTEPKLETPVSKNIEPYTRLAAHESTQFNAAQESGKSKTASQPIKATPLVSSEIERFQVEFKFYSPVQKQYKNVPSPKVGEKWKLVKTVPSGLVLLSGVLSFTDEIKDILKEKLLGISRDSDFDERPYLYDIERFKREDPRRSIQQRDTISVAWHPRLNLLATAGDGNIPRVWEVSGKTWTKRTFWHTGSPGYTLCWSPDGEMFISGEDVCDGNSGKYLWGRSSNFTSYFRYSCMEYNKLRGHCASFEGSAYPTITNNFSPWRPNSKQVVYGEYENNLILRNSRTGEIERIVDCGVSSKIIDFAWHPRGRFIAISFEEHNIRIIDIDEARIVDDLSVQNLAGWSPDGKLLVARKDKSRNDFLVWDALDTVERPMPEEIKSKIWFNRFFKNIDIDGLRYIKSVHDENYEHSTNIYSLESNELLFTVPKEVKSAAWSSVDGGLFATSTGSETSIWKL